MILPVWLKCRHGLTWVEHVLHVLLTQGCLSNNHRQDSFQYYIIWLTHYHSEVFGINLHLLHASKPSTHLPILVNCKSVSHASDSGLHTQTRLVAMRGSPERRFGDMSMFRRESFASPRTERVRALREPTTLELRERFSALFAHLGKEEETLKSLMSQNEHAERQLQDLRHCNWPKNWPLSVEHMHTSVWCSTQKDKDEYRIRAIFYIFYNCIKRIEYI